MIRALFASHGCPIAGDLRYGSVSALPDGSVALHASRLALPQEHIVLNLEQREFQAPLPQLWNTHFGFRDETIAV